MDLPPNNSHGSNPFSSPRKNCSLCRERSIHLPFPSVSWYFKPVPGVTVGQHHSNGFGPRTDSIFRRAPRFWGNVQSSGTERQVLHIRKETLTNRENPSKDASVDKGVGHTS